MSAEGIHGPRLARLDLRVPQREPVCERGEADAFIEFRSATLSQLNRAPHRMSVRTCAGHRPM